MDHQKLLRSSSAMILNRDVPSSRLSRSHSTANLTNFSGKRYNASWHAYSPSYSRYSQVYPSPYISQRHKYCTDSWYRLFHRPSPRYYQPWRSSYICRPYVGGPSYYRRYYYPYQFYSSYHPFSAAAAYGY